ncbi:lycopene cyclase domain-containing protein [Natronorubrum sp. JWXQ-INN-674]|uniref:Lycopene cyclase domain-containing protein n=1 Tax=Natronorubrum halalkaliphilum TaxID=2691917 RepID=A0A6B0VGY9_9EURY|nr:lycopene cyclase domain-containing protein [Natronorubrum halalkaliphilum]MXV61081.1 lycopene cyclase domain-containing protein [Natronorubrum halalkaliphilum]
MTPPLTYLGFHLVFTLPPIALLSWLAVRRERARWNWQAISGFVVLVALAVVYTTPWTNALIPEGVWWYGEGAVIATVWYTPIEEYLFFVLQTALTAFWLFHLLEVADVSLDLPISHRVVGVLAGTAICLAGWLLLGSTSTFYLGAILVWAGPILAIQWGFGLTYLVRARRQVLLAIAVPTLYLWFADWVAISLGIWMISETHTIGISVAGLPLEEMLFFLVTNVFIVQGIVLYVWVIDRLSVHPTGSPFRSVSRRLDGWPLDD